jgi:hypothetical protein
MYIRKTHTNNSSTGERYYTYRLVISQRVDGKPRQMTLLNLGRHFSVDQDLWASLCVRIEQLLSLQTELLPIELPTTVEKAHNALPPSL